MKKILSLLLSILLTFSVMSPLTVLAENGPHPNTFDFEYFDNISFVDYQYSTILMLDYKTQKATRIYPEKYNFQPPKGIKYEKNTNTLSLTDYHNEYVTFIFCCMGDDFKINLTGYNEFISIYSYSNGWGGSLTFEGEGELVLNRRMYDQLGGICILADGDDSILTVEEETKLKVYANTQDPLLPGSVTIDGSTAEEPFNIKGILTNGEITSEEYTHPIYEKYDVHNKSFNKVPDFDSQLTKANDDTIYAAYTTVHGGYKIYTLSYDEELEYYIATPYIPAANENVYRDFTLRNQAIYDSARNCYITNSTEQTDPEKLYSGFFIKDKALPMNLCVDDNGTYYGFEEQTTINEKTGEYTVNYTVYSLTEYNDFGLIATAIPGKNTLDNLTPLKTGEEKRISAYYGDGFTVNNGGNIIEPEAPEIIKIENAHYAGRDYIDVTFTSVKDAERYSLYVYEPSCREWYSEHSKKATTDKTLTIRYDYPQNGERQYFFVVASNKVGTSPESEVKSIVNRTTPGMEREVVSNGIKIKWNRNPASKYVRVYRRAENETAWKKLVDSKGSNYIDTTVKKGVKYQYAIRTFYPDGSYSASKKSDFAVIMSAPKLVSATNEAKGGIKVTWGKTIGADEYIVYRKTSGTSWKKLKVIQDGSTTSYIDTTAEKGTTYIYTVKALLSSCLSNKPYNKTGITVKCLGIPAIKLSNASNGVKISWGKVAGASKYRVYRKGTGETKWTTLKDTTSLSFTDTKASAGKKYTYTVKAISGKSISSCASKTILRLKNPTLKTVSKTTDGVKITWGGVAGAESYYVYRKTAKSGWTKIGETSTKSYVDTTAKKGTTYIYTVRAANGSYLSSYNSTGLKIKR